MKKKINLFIGGSTDSDISDNYHLAAVELGRIISERDYHVIFDGCSGLPALTFEKVKEFRKATIIYTEPYTSQYIHKYYHMKDFRMDRVIQLRKQSEMTDMVIDLSDAFIFMKGHMGTLEEIFRAINGNKNKEYNKPIVILNINHEWDDLANILSSCCVDDYYYITDNVIDGFNYIESELYKETSDFYKLYVANGYSERNYPMIEGNNHKLLSK